MTTMFPEDKTCAVCGKVSEHYVLTSTNTLGSSDLDLRPPEMQRSTMDCWVERCPRCKYVARSLEDKAPKEITKAWLKGETYNEKIGFKKKLADTFYKYYLLNDYIGRFNEAFLGLIWAAWVCDDAKDIEKAIFCREKAIEVIDQHLQLDDTLSIRRADLLRRRQQFDRLITEYQEKRFPDDLLNQIMAFQIQKAKEKDTNCYQVSDVVGE